MIVRPTFRGALCPVAHPDGCAAVVADWFSRAGAGRSPRRVLVIGSSGGLGLAARVCAAASGSATVGVSLDRPGTPVRTGTAGWYRAVAFEEHAARAGLRSATVVGDGFSDTVKARTAAVVKGTLGQVDLVIYSVAAPRRRHPRTGILAESSIKTIGRAFTERGYDLSAREVRTMTLDVASPAEVAATVSVMGGADWRRWMAALHLEGLLADGARTLAFSYVGPRRLWPSYRGGTLGAAKSHLEQTGTLLDTTIQRRYGGSARVAVMPALVTQASVVIPMNTLYTMLLLDAQHAGDDVLDQGRRAMEALMCDTALGIDDQGRLRLDDRELDDAVQRRIWSAWPHLTTADTEQLDGTRIFERQLRALYGFEIAGVDYAAEVDPVVAPGDRLVLP